MVHIELCHQQYPYKKLLESREVVVLYNPYELVPRLKIKSICRKVQLEKLKERLTGFAHFTVFKRFPQFSSIVSLKI
jgi:hypothetical protein